MPVHLANRDWHAFITKTFIEKLARDEYAKVAL